MDHAFISMASVHYLDESVISWSMRLSSPPPERGCYLGYVISGETSVSHEFPKVDGDDSWEGTCLCRKVWLALGERNQGSTRQHDTKTVPGHSTLQGHLKEYCETGSDGRDTWGDPTGKQTESARLSREASQTMYQPVHRASQAAGWCVDLEVPLHLRRRYGTGTEDSGRSPRNHPLGPDGEQFWSMWWRGLRKL